MRYNPPNFRLVSIDPGNNMGICISEVNVARRTLEVIEVFTLVVDKAIRHNSYERHIRYTKKELVEHYLTNVLDELLNYYDIDAIVYETAYVSRSLAAYESLMFYGRVIKKVGLAYDWDLMIESKTPSNIKSINGILGTSSDKSLVTEAVRNNKSILLPEHVELDELTEHAIDAIAIGYTVVFDLTRSLPTPR